MVRPWLVLILLAVPFTSYASNEISGQVFISTQGGSVYKLALVEVGFYPAEQMRAYLGKKTQAYKDKLPRFETKYQAAYTLQGQAEKLQERAEAAVRASIGTDRFERELTVRAKANEVVSKATETANNWLSVLSYLRSGTYYAEDLPLPTATSKTDADGRFTVDLPHSGAWVIVATASRKTLSSTEYYYWFVPVEAKDGSTVMLANDNLIGTTGSLLPDVQDNLFDSLGKKNLPLAEAALAKEDAEGRAVEEQRAVERGASIRRHLPELVAASQSRAVVKHPELKVLGSEINKKFLAEYQRLTAEKSPRLQEPDWPEKLADETASQP